MLLNEVNQPLTGHARPKLLLSATGASVFEAESQASTESFDAHSPVLQRLNSIFDVNEYKNPSRPLSLGLLSKREAALLRLDLGAPKMSDLLIRMPGSPFRVPKEAEQFVPIIKRAANFERRINPACFDEYYCYLTVQQGWVEKGTAQRPSPCHVDGFQGARWKPKVRSNHSYIVSNAVPTIWYAQPVDLEHLDESKHNFFFEMDRQVALSKYAHAWSPRPNEMVLMDCYCIHRGGLASRRVWRTFVRISFEVRIFDHIDNTHNPLFAYDWPLADRHIEKLGLCRWEPPAEQRKPSHA